MGSESVSSLTVGTIITYTILRDNDIGYTLYNIFDVQKCKISCLLMK